MNHHRWHELIKSWLPVLHVTSWLMWNTLDLCLVCRLRLMMDDTLHYAMVLWLLRHSRNIVLWFCVIHDGSLWLTMCNKDYSLSVVLCVNWHVMMQASSSSLSTAVVPKVQPNPKVTCMFILWFVWIMSQWLWVTVTLSLHPVTVTLSLHPVTVTLSLHPVTVTLSLHHVTVTPSLHHFTVTLSLLSSKDKFDFTAIC